MRMGPWILLLFVPGGLMGQDLAYQWQGTAVSTYNDNTPYLYSSDGLLNGSIGRGPDDQFTAGFRVDTVGALKSDWSESLIASANMALFTDNQYYSIAQTGQPNHPAWRVDTGSVQVLLEKAWQPFTVFYGGGILVRGNLGGGALQNAVHDGIRDVEFQLPYVGGYAAGPFLATVLKYPFFDVDAAGWNWRVSSSGRGVWDVVGILQDEVDLLGQLDATTGAVSFQFVVGGRLSLPGTGARQTSLYSNGLFFDSGIELSFGDFRTRIGYAVNPYGSAPIADYPAYRDQNQEFHWTFIWGQDNPLPWALRFFP